MHALSRRKFLQQSSVVLAGTLLTPALTQAFSKTAAITGIQLYSIRDDMKTDPAGTLKKLATMGYRYVEHANYIDRKFYGYPAKEFKTLLDGLGLKMLSGHTVMGKAHWDAATGQFTDAWKQTIEDAATMGQQFVISPWIDDAYRKDYNGLAKFMDAFNKSGELCKAAGMRFGYHNHDWEFSKSLNNTPIYDLILKLTDPQLVVQQLDIGNMYGGGGRAMDVLKRYPGRFLSLHVKDEIKSTANSEGYESCVLGKGIINTKQILDLARKQGATQHYIIEQESYQGKAPLQSAQEDLAVMKKWGYA
ncbi:MAG: sugar phosphate isomerase/epimerase [Williamsia sp.]|nr:sugar phosphate isomerase/epimerase [Williamsia sp.]